MHKAKIFSLAFATALGACLLAAPGSADELGTMAKGGKGGPPFVPAPSCGTNPDGTYCWMSPDVGVAWSHGYFGQGVSMTFVDDFSSNSTYTGDLGLGSQTQRHGAWTSEEGSMVATGAAVFLDDFSTESAIELQPGLNVVNASYGLVGAKRSYSPSFDWSQYPQEQSIIDAAQNGLAVISKAAGNDGVAVGSASKGKLDYLNMGLIGAQSAIFVGALDFNGTTAKPAALASYSNYAGSDTQVQDHFLVVGVEGDKTGLYGTSFAAPVVAGYAAIVGSKFSTDDATQITNRLLETARTDTLVNYDAATYGKGEASLVNALAPNGIW